MNITTILDKQHLWFIDTTIGKASLRLVQRSIPIARTTLSHLEKHKKHPRWWLGGKKVLVQFTPTHFVWFDERENNIIELADGYIMHHSWNDYALTGMARFGSDPKAVLLDPMRWQILDNGFAQQLDKAKGRL